MHAKHRTFPDPVFSKGMITIQSILFPFPFIFPPVAQWQFLKLSHVHRSPEHFVIRLRSWVRGSEFLVSFHMECPGHLPSWKSLKAMLLAMNVPPFSPTVGSQWSSDLVNRTSPWGSPVLASHTLDCRNRFGESRMNGKDDVWVSVCNELPGVLDS